MPSLAYPRGRRLEDAVSGRARVVRPKAGYHHGELRAALIAATRRLIGEHGADRFSLADACAAAGVSTAAPYRHFSDKEELLALVVAEGFGDLTSRARAAALRHPDGSEERILEIGRAYVGFGLGEPALFRMMFAPTMGRTSDERVTASGKACFQFVLDEVVGYCRATGVDGDADLIALQLWTFVHGVTSLLSDRTYAQIAPELDVDEMMTAAADRLLFRLPRRVLETPD
jgi:AcrR family transcriptional regulator